MKLTIDRETTIAELGTLFSESESAELSELLEGTANPRLMLIINLEATTLHLSICPPDYSYPGPQPNLLTIGFILRKKGDEIQLAIMTGDPRHEQKFLPAKPATIKAFIEIVRTTLNSMPDQMQHIYSLLDLAAQKNQ